jgi:hypothetical protein
MGWSTTLGAFAVAVAAVFAWRAAVASQGAVREVAHERLKDHWRRLAEAVGEVDRNARAYRQAMREQLVSTNGHEARARRTAAVLMAADRYQDACARLRLCLAAGPHPLRTRGYLGLLTDGHQPEAVADGNFADLVLEEIAEVQALLSFGPLGEDRTVAHRIARLRWRLVAAWRLRSLSRDGEARPEHAAPPPGEKPAN